VCGKETILGSETRRHELAAASQACYRERWGEVSHFAVYFGQKSDAANLSETVETILAGARRGHRFTLLLHRRQAAVFRRMGWHTLHTAIEIRILALLFTQRDLRRNLAHLQTAYPENILVRGAEGATLPDMEQSITFSVTTDIMYKHTPPPATEEIPLSEVPP